jgi:formate dehydrogenase accessory protein FdhE
MDEMNAADPILQRLSWIVSEWPALKEAAQIYETILPVLGDAKHAETGAGQISMTVEEARAKMGRGLPLLRGGELELDVNAVKDLMIQLTTAAEKMKAGLARRIRFALEDEALDVALLIPHVMAGDRDRAAAMAQGLQLDPDLVWLLAGNAMKPAMQAWSRQLAPLGEGISWDDGHCFVCGAYALLGELRDDNQLKHLRCGQCGADWRFRRLQCTHCGNTDHRTLGYLYLEGMPEKIQAETCDKCGSYLKVIPAFAPTPSDMLAVEDLATLHLDYIAKDRGYARQSGFIE